VEMSILILCVVYAALLLTIQNAVHSLNVLEGEFSDVQLRKTYVGAPPLVQAPSLPTVTAPSPPRAH
jgi:hypothetical protein